MQNDKALLRQVLAGGSQYELPVLDAPDCDQMLSNTPHYRCPTADNQDFQAVVMIKVHVEGRNDRSHVLML